MEQTLSWIRAAHGEETVICKRAAGEEARAVPLRADDALLSVIRGGLHEAYTRYGRVINEGTPGNSIEHVQKWMRMGGVYLIQNAWYSGLFQILESFGFLNICTGFIMKIANLEIGKF